MLAHPCCSQLPPPPTASAVAIVAAAVVAAHATAGFLRHAESAGKFAVPCKVLLPLVFRWTGLATPSPDANGHHSHIRNDLLPVKRRSPARNLEHHYRHTATRGALEKAAPPMSLLRLRGLASPSSSSFRLRASSCVSTSSRTSPSSASRVVNANRFAAPSDAVSLLRDV